jgi:hypothetical protein
MQLEQDTADSAERANQEKRWKYNNEYSTGIKNLHTSAGKLGRRITRN